MGKATSTLIVAGLVSYFELTGCERDTGYGYETPKPIVSSSVTESPTAGQKGSTANPVSSYTPTPFTIGPNLELNRNGVPKNLEDYVEKKSVHTKVFRDFGLDKICGSTPCIFNFDFAYFVARQGWDHYYMIDHGIPTQD